LQIALDSVDLTVIKRLLEDGRASFSSIAKETKLTDVAIKKRVEALKRKGVLKAISAELNYRVLGFENPVYVQIRSELSKTKNLIQKLNALDYVIELFQVLGEYNLLAKILINDLDSAEKIVNRLSLLDGIIDMKTLVVISELKMSNALPSSGLQKKL
jgi:DNA-binding Lrp family transcriptional regulator